MGARDHSEMCEVCGCQRGGLNDLRCDCDPCEICGEVGSPEEPCRCGRETWIRISLACLSSSLRWAGALHLSRRHALDELYQDGHYTGSRRRGCWQPNTLGVAAPGWESP